MSCSLIDISHIMTDSLKNHLDAIKGEFTTDATLLSYLDATSKDIEGVNKWVNDNYKDTTRSIQLLQHNVPIAFGFADGVFTSGQVDDWWMQLSHKEMITALVQQYPSPPDTFDTFENGEYMLLYLKGDAGVMVPYMCAPVIGKYNVSKQLPGMQKMRFQVMDEHGDGQVWTSWNSPCINYRNVSIGRWAIPKLSTELVQTLCGATLESNK